MAKIDWVKWNSSRELTSSNPLMADILAAHRFVAPAVAKAKPGDHECFCGWTGGDHYEHLVAQLLASEPEPAPAPVKKVAKKAPAKPVDTDS